MAEMTPVLKSLIKKHLKGRENDACWQHPKKRTWIIYHWALALIARAERVVFYEPEVLELGGPDTKVGSFKDPNPRTITIKVRGTGPHGSLAGVEREAWAFGEVSPNNNTNAYPYAMALKRGQDIVALDLLNLRGEVYSEAEADDFKEPPPERSPERPQPEPAPKGLPDPGPPTTPAEALMDFRDAIDNAAERGDAAKLRELWRDVGDMKLEKAEATKLRQRITKLGTEAAKNG